MWFPQNEQSTQGMDYRSFSIADLQANKSRDYKKNQNQLLHKANSRV